MSNLTGLNHGTFNTLSLINDTTGDTTEVRQLFLQGSIEQTIPNTPTNTQVLSIPGLLPELNARQLIVNSYSKTEIDNIVQNNPGPKGDKGLKGTKGSKGEGVSITGQKGDKGQQGSVGIKGDQGLLGPKGLKGNQGTGVKGDKGQLGSGIKGQKGDSGASGQTDISGKRDISDSYSKTEIDNILLARNTAINANTQNIINDQISIGLLQIADNGINAQLNTINATLASLQNQINAIPAPLDVIIGSSTYTPYRLVVQGSGLYQALYGYANKELVLTFQ